MSKEAEAALVAGEEVLVEDLVEEVVEEEDLEAEEVEVGVGTLTSGQGTGLARTQGKHMVSSLLFTWHSCWFYFKLRLIV